MNQTTSEVFRRIEDLKIERKITFRVRGAGEHVDRFLDKPVKHYYAYELEAAVEFSEEDNRLTFRSQRFNIKEYNAPPKSILFNSINWDATFNFERSQRRITLSARKNYKIDERLQRFFARYEQLAQADEGFQEYLLTTYLTRYFPYFEKATTEGSRRA